jgi:hypothetical protein
MEAMFVRTVSIMLLGLGFTAGCAPIGADEDADEETAVASDAISNGVRWVELAGNGFEAFELGSIATDLTRNVFVGGRLQGTHEAFGTVFSSAAPSAVVIALDKNGEHRWTWQGSGTGNQFVNGVGTDIVGNVYVAGMFEGELDWGGGSLVSAGDDDIFVMKLDRHGNPLFAKRFGGAGLDIGGRISVDALGGVYVGIDYKSDVDFGGGLRIAGAGQGTLLKLNAKGKYLFDRPLESSYTASVKSAAGLWGDVWVTSSFEGTLEVGGQTFTSVGWGGDVALIHYDPWGNVLSAAAYGGPALDWPSAIAVRPNGGAAVTGYMYETANFGGDDLVVASPYGDNFLMTVDAAGIPDWSLGIGSPSGGVDGGVAVDLAGNVAISGATMLHDLGDGPVGGAGFLPSGFVAKFDADGDLVWSDGPTPVPSPDPFALDFSGFGSLAFDWSGHLLMTGAFWGNFSFAGAEGSTLDTSSVVTRMKP